MWQDFKKFALKGNVVDLAVAVVIGGAFNKIVKSLVDHILMPLVGTLLGGVNFEELKTKVGDAEIQYGLFIQNIVDFLIIAFSIFLIVKVYKKLEKKEEEKGKKPDSQEDLLRQIRDLLSQRQSGVQPNPNPNLNPNLNQPNSKQGTPPKPPGSFS